MKPTFLKAFARSRKFVPVQEMKPAHSTFELSMEIFRQNSQKHLIPLPKKLSEVSGHTYGVGPRLHVLPEVHVAVVEDVDVSILLTTR